jgi:hypothetical protein
MRCFLPRNVISVFLVAVIFCFVSIDARVLSATNGTQCQSLALSAEARESLGLRRFQWCVSTDDADRDSFGGFGIYIGGSHSTASVGVVLRLVGQSIGFVHVAHVNDAMLWASYRVCSAGRYVIDPIGYAFDAGDVCRSATRLLESPFPIDVARDVANCVHRPNMWIGPPNMKLIEALLVGDVTVRAKWLEALDFLALLVDIEEWIGVNAHTSSDSSAHQPMMSVSFEPLLNSDDARQAAMDSKMAAHKDIVEFECTSLTRRQACFVGESTRWIFDRAFARFGAVRFHAGLDDDGVAECSSLVLAGTMFVDDLNRLRSELWRLIEAGKRVVVAGASILDAPCIAAVFVTNHKLRALVRDVRVMLQLRHVTAARVSFVDVALAHSLLFGLDIDTIRHLNTANEAALITAMKKIC